MKCLFFDVIVSSTSTLKSALDVGDAEWILHIDAMRLNCVQVLHPSILFFVDVSWVHDFKDAKFHESIEFLWFGESKLSIDNFPFFK